MQAETSQTRTAENPATDCNVADNDDNPPDQEDSSKEEDSIEHEQYVFQRSPPNSETDRMTSQHVDEIRKHPEAESEI